ncbi:unnamed protein product [Haemonchus placei]|uniref:Lipoprotein n=1 Tax=Haemonchus placei TaxID=6290 RepID=A0A0N4WR95_HAEPC|nr:unnamed protein product [Haemonchus placei]
MARAVAVLVLGLVVSCNAADNCYINDSGKDCFTRVWAM